MNTETIREYCIAKPGVTESFPFGGDALVFKVGGTGPPMRMFALLSTESQPATINLKCDPERAVQLREEHTAVTPGYHMNKTHWNTITLDGSVRTADVQEWIDHSYALVRASLPKAVQTELSKLE